MEIAKVIGGEKEVERDNLYHYTTDSGRSSIRLILQSGLESKKFLVPNFLCEVILDVLEEFKVDYTLYNVEKDLTTNLSDYDLDEFEVLFVIDYFGKENEILSNLSNPDLIVIQDQVFLPIVKQPKNIKNWIGFNSLRKLFYVPEGSFVKSTIELDHSLILRTVPDYVGVKYKAKEVKFDFLTRQMFDEKDYLELTEKANKALKDQKEIYTISDKSLSHLLMLFDNIEEEKRKRIENYDYLVGCFENESIHLPESGFRSFFILSVDRRDELRTHLAENGVYLPTHWPNTYDLTNRLYKTLLPIPVDSRYNIEDFERVVGLIKHFYE